LASSALVRVGLAVATVSGTLALMAFAGSVPPLRPEAPGAPAVAAVLQTAVRVAPKE